MFDSVNLPVKAVNDGGPMDQFGCTTSYISIASLYRPNEDYRLCGQRRGIKLVTTYNVVLINFVTTGLSDPTAGFSMIFRVIQQQQQQQKQPSAASPQPMAIGAPQLDILSSNRFVSPAPPLPPTFTSTLAILTSPRINAAPPSSSTLRFVRSVGLYSLLDT